MQEDRDQLIEKTRKEDERSDLKQHADGMLRDFEKFNKNSSNRAIWELVQNACDLTTQCKIEIDYRDYQFSFSHNGKAFTTKTLISLVKQVSGKYGDEDIPEVGKYGTGFLTTHTFGRRFKLNSFLDAGGYYLPIKDFEIDRTPKIWQDLSDNISDQKKRVYDLLEKESAVQVSDLKTTFTYFPETNKELEYIRDSSKYLDDYIPLVLTINNRLNEVVIRYENGTIDTYRFNSKEKIENDKEINLHKTVLVKNDEEIHLYSIKDEIEEIEIILPINKNNEVIEFNEKIARLFYYYPLIGSEDFGVNFIINCNKFLPKEPRDTIHLKSDKDQVKEDEEANRQIIDKCSVLIFSFLESNIIEVKNPLFYTKINFRIDSDDALLNEYFIELNKKWNTNLTQLPFVKTNDGFKTINSVSYLSKDFLNSEDSLFDCFYELVSHFYFDIPVKEDIKIWSNHAINWNNETTIFINHSDLLIKISECGLQDFNKASLVLYYKYIIEFVDVAYFNNFTLIPNIEGEFKNIGVLLEPQNLNDKLIELGKVLIPSSIAKLIHPDFIFSFSLNSFNRRNFSDGVKNTLDEKNIGDSIFYPEYLNNGNYHFDLVESKPRVEESYFKSLLDFCKLTNSVESTSKPSLLIKKISIYYNWDDSLIHLANLSEDIENIEYRSIRKALIKIFCNLIALHNNDWVKENLDFLHELCSLYDDSYKEVYNESKIYPNQLFELHLSESLKRDSEVEEYIKGIFLKVKNNDINEILSRQEFNQFLPEENFINNRYLTIIIEDILAQDDINNTDSHPHGKTILSIIPKLTEKHYQQLFPQLNDKKANIMISVVSKEETKEDLFKIISLDDTNKIKLLSKLSEVNDLEALIQAGQLKQKEDARKNRHLVYIKEIGLKIQNLIQLQLDSSLAETINIVESSTDEKLTSVEEQNGQDFIIYKSGSPIYYIEVKSRWDSNGIVALSKRQVEKCAQNKENYAVITVDVAKHKSDSNSEKEDLSFDILSKYVSVNIDLGDDFDNLIRENQKFDDDLEKTKLIEFRGHIPQERIKKKGIPFDTFINKLKSILTT